MVILIFDVQKNVLPLPMKIKLFLLYHMKKIIILLSVLFTFSGCGERSCKPETIRVVTFNVRYDTPRDSLNAWPNRKEMVNAMFRFHGFDIIGTQEALHHQLLDMCELPEYAYFGAGRDDGIHTGEHSAIIYKKDRFQVLDSGNFWLSETPDKPGLGWDATCCNRICSWMKFKDANTKKQFYVFNVHYDHQGVVARRESSKLMLQKIKEIAGDLPVLFIGDLNATPEAEPTQIIKAAMRDAYDITAQPPYGPVGTFNGFRWNATLLNRIDYIFVSDHFSVLKYAALTDALERRWPSDHLPVLADVILK